MKIDLKDRNSLGWRLIASVAVLGGFAGFFKLGYEEGRNRALDNVANHIYAVGGDYRYKTRFGVKDELEPWC